MKAEAEIIQERNLVNAAQKNNVQILIHASVARAGDEKNFVDWNNEDRTPVYHAYWKEKLDQTILLKNQKFLIGLFLSQLGWWIIF